MIQAMWFNAMQMSSFVILIIVWALFWKGVALWRAARRNSPGWFVALLIINTLGIFEIIYLLMTRRHCSCGECEACQNGSQSIFITEAVEEDIEEEDEEDEEPQEEVVVVRRRSRRT